MIKNVSYDNRRLLRVTRVCTTFPEKFFIIIIFYPRRSNSRNMTIIIVTDSKRAAVANWLCFSEILTWNMFLRRIIIANVNITCLNDTIRRHAIRASKN